LLSAQQEWCAPSEPYRLCRKHGISQGTFYKWKARYGGLEVSDARKLKSLEAENARLKCLLADAMLDNVVLKDLLGKS
jgi:putative transposase